MGVSEMSCSPRALVWFTVSAGAGDSCFMNNRISFCFSSSVLSSSATMPSISSSLAMIACFFLRWVLNAERRLILEGEVHELETIRAQEDANSLGRAVEDGALKSRMISVCLFPMTSSGRGIAEHLSAPPNAAWMGNCSGTVWV